MSHVSQMQSNIEQTAVLYIDPIIGRGILPAQMDQRRDSILPISFRLSLIVRSFWFSGNYRNEIVLFLFFINNGSRFLVSAGIFYELKLFKDACYVSALPGIF